jgi:hypothetical protein
MGETILRMHNRGLPLSIWRMFSLTVMTGITSLSTAQEHLEEKQFYACLVNRRRYVFTLNPPGGKTLGILIHQPVCCHRKIYMRNACYSIRCVKHKRHCYNTTQLTVSMTTVQCEVLPWTGLRMIWLGYQLKDGHAQCTDGYNTLNRYSKWNSKKTTFSCAILP